MIEPRRRNDLFTCSPPGPSFHLIHQNGWFLGQKKLFTIKNTNCPSMSWNRLPTWHTHREERHHFVSDVSCRKVYIHHGSISHLKASGQLRTKSELRDNRNIGTKEKYFFIIFKCVLWFCLFIIKGLSCLSSTMYRAPRHWPPVHCAYLITQPIPSGCVSCFPSTHVRHHQHLPRSSQVSVSSIMHRLVSDLSNLCRFVHWSQEESDLPRHPGRRLSSTTWMWHEGGPNTEEEFSTLTTLRRQDNRNHYCHVLVYPLFLKCVV